MSKSRFVGFGLLAWVIAVGFGAWSTVQINGPVTPPPGSGTSVLQRYEVVNVTAAAASFGFAIAGGLCFIAAALADRNAGRESTSDHR